MPCLSLIETGTVPRGVVWSDQSGPGIARRRAGRNFRYLGLDRRPIRDPATLDRIKALAVPPAWTDVWINPDPRGHLQAFGRDARGRKQYRYHADFRAHREAVKFEQLPDFGQCLPAIRRRVQRDLAAPGLGFDKVVATVVRLLEATSIRVGNEEYARTNQSYGLTTLRDDHVAIRGAHVELAFRGKSGRSHQVALDDRRLARIIAHCRDLPGEVLFQYIGADGVSVPVASSDVNAYLRRNATSDVTAKVFRTWSASVLAASTLAALDVPETEAEQKAEVKAAVVTVARELGNTPAVARRSYIHPHVLDTFPTGELRDAWRTRDLRGPRSLPAAERRFLALIDDR